MTEQLQNKKMDGTKKEWKLLLQQHIQEGIVLFFPEVGRKTNVSDVQDKGGRFSP